MATDKDLCKFALFGLILIISFIIIFEIREQRKIGTYEVQRIDSKRVDKLKNAICSSDEQMICTLEDGTKIKVNSYKKIEK